MLLVIVRQAMDVASDSNQVNTGEGENLAIAGDRWGEIDGRSGNYEVRIHF